MNPQLKNGILRIMILIIEIANEEASEETGTEEDWTDLSWNSIVQKQFANSHRLSENTPRRALYFRKN